MMAIMIGPDSTSFELKEARPETAVLGIGSFEQHSHHLPLETDFFFACSLSREVAERLEAFLLPPLPYSCCLEHRGFAGTVIVRPATLKELIWDIAASAADWGIRYLVLLNFHGGNFVLNPTVREWNMAGRRPHLLLVEFYSGCSGTHPNLHACEVETSLMLSLAPEKVRKGRAVDFVPPYPREDLGHFGMKVLSPEGVWGFPTKATAEKGRRWIEEGVAYSVQRVLTLKSGFEEHEG